MDFILKNSSSKKNIYSIIFQFFFKFSNFISFSIQIFFQISCLLFTKLLLFSFLKNTLSWRFLTSSVFLILDSSFWWLNSSLTCRSSSLSLLTISLLFFSTFSSYIKLIHSLKNSLYVLHVFWDSKYCFHILEPLFFASHPNCYYSLILRSISE